MRNRMDPFSQLPVDARDKLEDASPVNDLLRAVASDEALSALHNFITHRLSHYKGTDLEDMAAGKLRDYLCYHLQEQDREELAEKLHRALSPDLRVSQAAELFIAVANKTN